MVSRLVWDQDAAGSNPVASTKILYRLPDENLQGSNPVASNQIKMTTEISVVIFIFLYKY